MLLVEAGYGCIVCGSPIVTFVRRAFDEVVLCPAHALLANTGELEEAQISKPVNVGSGAASGTLVSSSRYPVTRFKGVIVVNDEMTVSADEEALFRLRVVDGRLLVSVKAYDSDGNVQAEIVDNEWVGGDADAVSIEHSANKLNIVSQHGVPILSLDAGRTPLQLSVSLVQNGVPIAIGSKGISVGDRPASFMDDGYAGCVIDIDTEAQSVTMNPDPRHGGHSIIVSERDPFQRIVKALNAMASLRSHVEDDPFSHL
jgi:hypothetical protein